MNQKFSENFVFVRKKGRKNLNNQQEFPPKIDKYS